MRHVLGAAGALLLALGACSKHSHTEQATADRTNGEQNSPAEQTDSPDASTPPPHVEPIERSAGTYDPLRDQAPHTGPGAPHVGDTPGTGLEPIDSPVKTPPRPIPAPPLGVPPGTTVPPPK